MDDLDPFGGKKFPQGLGIGAVPLAGGDDRLDFRVGFDGGVDPLDPGTEGAGETGGFGLAYLGQGRRVSNEQVIQVHRDQVGGQHHLHRDGGGQAYPGARRQRRGLAHDVTQLRHFAFLQVNFLQALGGGEGPDHLLENYRVLALQA